MMRIRKVSKQKTYKTSCKQDLKGLSLSFKKSPVINSINLNNKQKIRKLIKQFLINTKQKKRPIFQEMLHSNCIYGRLRPKGLK